MPMLFLSPSKLVNNGKQSLKNIGWSGLVMAAIRNNNFLEPWLVMPNDILGMRMRDYFILFAVQKYSRDRRAEFPVEVDSKGAVILLSLFICQQIIECILYVAQSQVSNEGRDRHASQSNLARYLLEVRKRWVQDHALYHCGNLSILINWFQWCAI